MSRAALDRALGTSFVGGLCKLHTLRAAVRDRARQDQILTHLGRELVPVEPYRDWLRSVLATGTLTYKGLTLTDLRRNQLAEVLGLHSVTLSKVANGHTVSAKSALVRAIGPFMALCTTEAAWSITVGQHIPDAESGKYIPLGSGVVDRYGRLWQLRDPGWCPAHRPGSRPRYTPRPAHVLQYPVRVVYLPPSLQTSVTP